MARLIDDMMRYGAKKYWHPRSPDERPRDWFLIDHRGLLETAIVVDVSNVAKLAIDVLTTYGDDLWGRALKTSDFPCVVPPWSHCFLEYQNPRPGNYRRIGALILRAMKAHRAALGMVYVDLGQDIVLLQAAQWEWGKDGALIEPLIQMTSSPDEQLECMGGGFIPDVWVVALTAFSLMRCKNVTVSDAVIPPKLAKAHIKRTGKPFVQYKVIEIEPMRQAMRSAGGSGVDQFKRALHICRGHFKDYREHGLFGKAKGLYWWDQHVRGTSEVGVIVKDYTIKGAGA